jgi:hypothetical protein
VSEQEQGLNGSAERARQFFFVSLGFEQCGRSFVHFNRSGVLVERVKRVCARTQALRQRQFVPDGLRDRDGEIGQPVRSSSVDANFLPDSLRESPLFAGQP